MADDEVAKQGETAEEKPVHTDDEALGNALKQAEVNGDELQEAVEEHKQTGKPMGAILEKKGLLDKIMGVLSMDITPSGGESKEGVDIKERETLADALLQAGWISEDQLAEAQLKARESGVGLGKVLLDEGFASVSDVEAALAYRRRTGKPLTRTLIDVRLGKTAEPSKRKKFDVKAIKKKRARDLARRLVELELIKEDVADDLLTKARKAGQPLDEYLVERDFCRTTS